MADVGNGLFDAQFQLNRVHPRHNRLQTLDKDRFGQHGGRRRAVASHVTGLGGDFADHPATHIFVRVFQVDFLGNRHAVFGYGWRAKALLQDHVATLGAQRDFDRLGQFGHAPPHRIAGLLIKCNHLGHR